MSSNQSYIYSSTSYSSSSTIDGRTNTHAYSEESHTDPSGTTTRTMYKEPGRPVVEQTSSYPTGSRLSAGGRDNTQGRIEDVSEQEAAKRYEENIEDEYAKREGGA